jgi:hypothetical protein
VLAPSATAHATPWTACELILLTDLLTTDVDNLGCGWTRPPSASPCERPVRHPRTDLDGPNLATEQMPPAGALWLWDVGGADHPATRPRSRTGCRIHPDTGKSLRRDRWAKVVLLSSCPCGRGGRAEADMRPGM